MGSNDLVHYLSSKDRRSFLLRRVPDGFPAIMTYVPPVAPGVTATSTRSSYVGFEGGLRARGPPIPTQGRASSASWRTSGPEDHVTDGVRWRCGWAAAGVAAEKLLPWAVRTAGSESQI